MICYYCKRDLPESEFCKPKTKIRIRHKCKDCHKEKLTKRRITKDGIISKDGMLYQRNGTGLSIVWTNRMIELLQLHYPITKNEELPDLFGISERAIRRKAKELGLKKDKSWMNKVLKENLFYAEIAFKKKVRENKNNNGRNNKLVCI